MVLHVVIGPPAAGKSTFVRSRAAAGDIRIDFDELANVLSGRPPANHTHDRGVIAVAKAARSAAIDRAMDLAEDRDVWLIHSTPSASLLTRYREAGAVIHVVDPGETVVRDRVKRERPWQMGQVVKKWYATQTSAQPPAPAVSTTERGLGWHHQQTRAHLMAVHTDGSHCWWCAAPMYRDATRNWDKQSLAADHAHARAVGGTQADRLLHGICNKQRSVGRWDDFRPATLGIPAAQWSSRDAAKAAAHSPVQGRANVFQWPT